MGKYNRVKGQKGTNELLDILAADGLDVQSVDASGAIKRETGDIVLRFNRRKYSIEVKREEKLPTKTLNKAKADSDILMLRKNRKGWKVYMDLKTFIVLLLNNRS
jgi:Holliday junction resolvase